ncbi:MAG: c-type cytochrome, partial [Planctomycetota bacterium]
MRHLLLFAVKITIFVWLYLPGDSTSLWIVLGDGSRCWALDDSFPNSNEDDQAETNRNSGLVLRSVYAQDHIVEHWSPLPRRLPENPENTDQSEKAETRQQLPARAIQPVAQQWRGSLEIDAPGDYRLVLYGHGRVQLRLDDQELLPQTNLNNSWTTLPVSKLEAGRQRFELTLDQITSGSRVAVYWSSSQFTLEPIPARYFHHEPSDWRDESRARDLQHGELLFDALRCGSCHDLPAASERHPPLAGPSLQHLGGQIQPSWLIEHLLGTNSAAGRRMPHYSLDRPQADALAAYLLKNSVKRTPLPQTKPAPELDAKQRGRKLFLSVGCLACHTFDGLGRNDFYGGGDLTAIARKRPPDFFGQWLSRPESLNQHHRMPVFSFSPEELRDLSAWLASGQLRSPSADSGDAKNPRETTSAPTT